MLLLKLKTFPHFPNSNNGGGKKLIVRHKQKYYQKRRGQEKQEQTIPQSALKKRMQGQQTHNLIKINYVEPGFGGSGCGGRTSW